MATPKIDAYFRELRTTERPSNEQIARAIGDSPAMLEERLRDAATFYLPKYRKLFTDALFVFPERRLYSYDGVHLLEYRLRDDPNLPESELNQQTSMGMVVLYRKLGAYSQHR
jgi:transcriptional regulator with XRE-family HTH domain